MKNIFSCILLLAAAQAKCQTIINSWIMNANGKVASQWFNNGGNPPTYTFTTMTDSADALKVCYNADTVWVRSQGLTDNMGKWLNPGGALAQNYTHRFPRNPTVATTRTIASKEGAIGLLLNGVPIFGLSNAYSWNGTANVQNGGGKIWNVEVGKSEGFVLDTALGAHPQQQGAYHSHTTPYRLYKNSPSSQHSPIVGWAFDGYPVYGPYGYSDPMNAGSAVARMKSGYSLRNITTRTTLPYGITASQTGPAVSATYPIGTYCEDYEWLGTNGGDLDKYNGRTCITPEFPQGTYAYFVTVDAAGNAAFPYYIGIEYYGQPDTKNFPNGPAGNGLTIPNYISSCRNNTVGIQELSGSDGIKVYPNPAINGQFTIQGFSGGKSTVSIVNTYGQVVYKTIVIPEEKETVKLEIPGTYFVRFDSERGGMAIVKRVVVW